MARVYDADSNNYVDINSSMWGERWPLGIDVDGVATDIDIVSCEIDNVGPWLVTIDQPHHQIHEGEMFVWAHEDATLADTETIVMAITPASGTYAHMNYHVTCPLAFTVALYETPTLSASGTTVSESNRNRNSAKDSNITVTHTPTVSGGANGTLLEKYYIGGGAQRAGGDNRSASEWVLKAGETYLLIVTSRANSNSGAVIIECYVEGAIDEDAE